MKRRMWWAARSQSIAHKRKLREWERRIQEINHEIEKRTQEANEHFARLKSLNPRDIVVIFDARRSTGFLYKNMPFARTILGPVVGILSSFAAVEVLHSFGLRPSGWPMWTQPLFYVLVTIAVTAAINHAIVRRYDYGECAYCGKRKYSYEPLCPRCQKDYGLQEIGEKIPKLIEKHINEDQEKDKERQDHPTELFCLICGSRLRWDISWDSYVCSVHGDFTTQGLYSERKLLEEEILFLRQSSGANSQNACQ